MAYNGNAMKSLVTTILLIICSQLLLAQNLPSVDVEAANMQIQQFENENRSLETSVTLLEDSIVRLEEEIGVWSQWKTGIEQVFDLLGQQAEQLVEVLSQIGSRSIVERAQSALLRYDRIAKLLSNKSEELAGRIATAVSLVTGHTNTVALYRIRLEQNQRNISLLKEAIAKSASAESLIETYLNQLDTILEDASRLLSAPEDRSTDDATSDE